MLRYLIQKPTVSAAQNKMIILLHGYGSNEHDLFGFAPYLPKDTYIVSVQAPIPLWNHAHAWYSIDFTPAGIKVYTTEEAQNSIQQIQQFIVSISEEYQVATKEISLCGFSQGAIMSLAVAFHYPQLVKKVAAMSGYAWAEVMPAHYDKAAVQQVKILMTHGTQDEVIPVAMPRKGVEWLQSQGIDYEYKEYKGMGHGVAPDCFQDVLRFLTSS
jgi:phospholipase/carboxylesterase